MRHKRTPEIPPSHTTFDSITPLLPFPPVSLIHWDTIGRLTIMPLRGESHPRPLTFIVIACLLSALSDGLLPLVEAQQPSPFEGQGLPPERPDGSPVDVFVSAFLERVVAVDDNEYQFEAVLFIRFSWEDPRAWPAVVASTNASLRTSNLNLTESSCTRLCNAGQVWCCEDIWLPGAALVNVEAFPEGRTEQEGISFAGNATTATAVAWAKRMHGIFYSPMGFRDFPFDRQHLQVIVQSEGPGYAYRPSSRAATTYAYNGANGDDISGWKILDLDIRAYSLGSSSVMEHAGGPDKDDPFPWPSTVASTSQCALNSLGPAGRRQLAAISESQLARATSLPGTVVLEGGVLDCRPRGSQEFILMIRIARLSNYYVYNIIVPMFLMVYLSFLVFAIHPNELAARVTVGVTFFLALTTLQFVVNGQLPDASYVTKLHIIILQSYGAIAICIIESIVVHFISRRDIILHKRKARQLSDKVSEVEARRRSVLTADKSISGRSGGSRGDRTAGSGTVGPSRASFRGGEVAGEGLGPGPSPPRPPEGSPSEGARVWEGTSPTAEARLLGSREIVFEGGQAEDGGAGAGPGSGQVEGGGSGSGEGRYSGGAAQGESRRRTGWAEVRALHRGTVAFGKRKGKALLRRKGSSRLGSETGNEARSGAAGDSEFREGASGEGASGEGIFGMVGTEGSGPGREGASSESLERPGGSGRNREKDEEREGEAVGGGEGSRENSRERVREEGSANESVRDVDRGGRVSSQQPQRRLSQKRSFARLGSVWFPKLQTSPRLTIRRNSSLNLENEKMEHLEAAVADLNESLDLLEDPYHLANITIMVDRFFFTLMPIVYFIMFMIVLYEGA